MSTGYFWFINWKRRDRIWLEFFARNTRDNNSNIIKRRYFCRDKTYKKKLITHIQNYGHILIKILFLLQLFHTQVFIKSRENRKWINNDASTDLPQQVKFTIRWRVHNKLKIVTKFAIFYISLKVVCVNLYDNLLIRAYRYT